MAALRDEAEALAEAVEFLNLRGVGQVIAWADARLLTEEIPSGALCDVALAGRRDPSEVATLLRAIPDTPDPSNVGRLLILLADAVLRRDPGRAVAVASALRMLSWEGRIEDAGLDEIALWARDALILADEGDSEKARRPMVDRLAAELDRAASAIPIGWSSMAVE